MEDKALPVLSDVFPSAPASHRPSRPALTSKTTLVHTPGGFEQALLEGKPAPRSARISNTSALPPDAHRILVTEPPPYRPRAVTVFLPEQSTIATAGPSLTSRPLGGSAAPKGGDEDKPLAKRLASVLRFPAKRDPSPPKVQESTLGDRPGLISSESDPWLAPKNWNEFNQLYVEGKIDLSHPPEPPVSIASRFPSPNFPTKEDNLDTQFAAPIGPLELIRQQTITRYKVLIPNAPAIGDDLASSAASTEVPSLARDSSISSHAYSVHTPSQAHHAQYHTFSTLLARVEKAINCRWLSIALILPDDERFLASKGFPRGMRGIPRDISFASHAILRDQPMIVEDVAFDWRFRRGPLAEILGIRFYAGFPLSVPTSAVDPRPIAIGVLSCLDSAPMRLQKPQMQLLYDLPLAHLTKANQRAIRRALASEISREIERLSGSTTFDAFPGYITGGGLMSSTQVKPRNTTALERRFIDWRTQLAQNQTSSNESHSTQASSAKRRGSDDRPPLRRGSDERPPLASTRRRGSDDLRSLPMVRRSTSNPSPLPPPKGALPALPVQEQRRPSLPDAFAPSPFAVVPPIPPSRLGINTSTSTLGSQRSPSREEESPVQEIAGPVEQFQDAPAVEPEASQQTLFAAAPLSTVLEEASEASGPATESVASTSAATTETAPSSPVDRRTRVYAAACRTVGKGLGLDFVYIVSMRIRPLLFAAGHEEVDLELLASYQLPLPAPHFQPSLHLRALRSPAGGLLYRNPDANASAGFGGGILLPILECKPGEENIISDTTNRGEGEALLLCGFWKDRTRQFTEDELNAMSKIADRIKVSIEDQEI